MTAYTHTAIGTIATAENARFTWFWGQDGYVFDKVEGRSLYLPVGGYSKSTGFGSDAADADVVAAARAFVLEIAAENARIELASDAGEEADVVEALAVVKAIPAAAINELDAINADYAAAAARVNESGEGYVNRADWTSKTGRDVLARHGLAHDQIDRIARAIQTLQG